ncbi:MAG TPA: hypothetical protein PK228_20900 [Saprospiraceae bacterium]|nr:hypothetical protein [Saprospiraceae bacterium]
MAKLLWQSNITANTTAGRTSTNITTKFKVCISIDGNEKLTKVCWAGSL